jgi:hypothetical protein
MRHLMILTCLSVSVLSSELVWAQDLPIEKGKRWVVVMTTKTEQGATAVNSTLITETTITGVSDASITYDQHMTGKGSAAGFSYDLPPQDMKNQSYARPPKDPAAPSSGTASNPNEMDLDVNTPVFKGKVRVIHVKTETSETWASKEPFEALITLSGDQKVKVKCNYARNSSTGGTKLDAELLTLAELPIVMVYMHTTTSGDGSKSELTSILQEVH